MELSFKKNNKTLIVKVAGEIDHHTSKELKRQTENIMMELRTKNLVFSFQDVTFMDSSGIGMMIGRYKQVQALGGRLAIACANEYISQLIRLTGLGNLLPVFVSLEEACIYTEGREQGEV